ncbi:MAG TPA: MATE family efflux transporter [Polyangia bacterium]|nr:MATE family efflux transporter [Polyangia bacterium]
MAGPIAVSMLSYSIMTLVDTLVVGRLGTASLAGVGLGGTVAFALLCFWFGLLRGTKTLVAQAIGAGRRDLVGAYRAAALGTALVAGVAMIAVGQVAASLLGHVAATPAAGHAARTYLHIRNLAAPMTLTFGALREVRYGEGDARSPMLASIAANVVNVALSTTFVFACGWGVAGVAAATALAQSSEAAFLWLLERRIHGRITARATREHVRALVRIGLPTGLQLGLEVGSFAILTAFIASLSETQMAAHQIALQAVQFSFLPAFAIAEGAQVLAGQAVGARREALVMRVAWLAVLTAGVYTAVCSLAFALGAPLIVAGFTSSAALAAVTVRLLRVAALFQVSDGANIVARAVLRGVGDMRFAAVIGVLTAWLMTPPLTWLLGAHAHLGAAGGWLGLCGESVLGATLLWRRLRSGAWRAAPSVVVDGGTQAQAA